MGLHTPQQEQSAKVLLKTALSLILIAGVFGFLGHKLYAQREQLTSIAWGQYPQWLALHLLLMVATFFFLMIGWQQAARISGACLSMRQGAASFLVSNLGKYLPGKIWMFAGRVRFCKQWGFRTEAILTGSGLEIFMQLLAAAPFFALFLGNPEITNNQIAPWFLGGATVAGLVVILCPGLIFKGMDAALRIMKRPSLGSPPKRTQIIGLWLTYTLCWIAYGLSGWTMAQALGMGDQLAILVTAAACVTAWLTGFLSFLTPGGLGVREGVLFVLLDAFTSEVKIVLLALVLRLSWTVVEMLGALVGWFQYRSLSNNAVKDA